MYNLVPRLHSCLICSCMKVIDFFFRSYFSSFWLEVWTLISSRVLGLYGSLKLVGSLIYWTESLYCYFGFTLNKMCYQRREILSSFYEHIGVFLV